MLGNFFLRSAGQQH